MRIKCFFSLFFLLFLIGCGFKVSPSISSVTVQVGSQIIPLITQTAALAETPAQLFTGIQESINKPQVAHWLINSQSDRQIVYVLGDDLKLINQFSDFILDGFLDPESCLIVDITHHYGKNDDLNQSEGFNIEWKNLRGESVDSKGVVFPHSSDDTYNIRISPNMDWIAYKQARAWENLYGIADSQKQDVFILPVEFDQEVESIKLTENSGAWFAEIAWSPDGNYLAYTDFDVDGNQQIFLYDPIAGVKELITDLGHTESQIYVFDFEWSKDSKNIVFLSGKAINNENQFLGTTRALGLLVLESKEIKWIYQETQELDVEILGIGKTGLLVLKEAHNMITWYDIKTGEKKSQYALDDRLYPILFNDTAAIMVSDGYPGIRIYDSSIGEMKDSQFDKKLGLFHVINTKNNGDYFSCPVP